MTNSRRDIDDLKIHSPYGIRYEKFRIKWFNSRDMHKEAIEAEQCLEFWKHIEDCI